MWRLDLDRYFFPEISVKARKEHMDCAKDSLEKKPEVEVSIGYGLSEKQKRVAVEVKVDSVDLVDEDPYEFRVQVFGSFQLTHDEGREELDKEFRDVEKLLVRNCAQILVGSIRDTVFGLTAKAPYGPLYLDTVYIGLENIPDRSEDLK